MNTLPDAVPAGFVPVKLGSTFATHSAELYARWHDDHLQVGFVVQPHQVNPGGRCHGGMLSLLADIVLSSAAQYQTDIPRQFLPTISLQLDYLAPAPLGAWVQGDAQVLRVTRSLVFAQGLASADGTPILRVSGVCKIGAPFDGEQIEGGAA